MNNDTLYNHDEENQQCLKNEVFGKKEEGLEIYNETTPILEVTNKLSPVYHTTNRNDKKRQRQEEEEEESGCEGAVRNKKNY